MLRQSRISERRQILRRVLDELYAKASRTISSCLANVIYAEEDGDPDGLDLYDPTYEASNEDD